MQAGPGTPLTAAAASRGTGDAKAGEAEAEAEEAGAEGEEAEEAQTELAQRDGPDTEAGRETQEAEIEDARAAEAQQGETDVSEGSELGAAAWDGGNLQAWARSAVGTSRGVSFSESAGAGRQMHAEGSMAAEAEVQPGYDAPWGGFQVIRHGEGIRASSSPEDSAVGRAGGNSSEYGPSVGYAGYTGDDEAYSDSCSVPSGEAVDALPWEQQTQQTQQQEQHPAGLETDHAAPPLAPGPADSHGRLSAHTSLSEPLGPPLQAAEASGDGGSRSPDSTSAAPSANAHGTVHGDHRQAMRVVGGEPSLLAASPNAAQHHVAPGTSPHPQAYSQQLDSDALDPDPQLDLNPALDVELVLELGLSSGTEVLRGQASLLREGEVPGVEALHSAEGGGAVAGAGMGMSSGAAVQAMGSGRAEAETRMDGRGFSMDLGGAKVTAKPLGRKELAGVAMGGSGEDTRTAVAAALATGNLVNAGVVDTLGATAAEMTAPAATVRAARVGSSRTSGGGGSTSGSGGGTSGSGGGSTSSLQELAAVHRQSTSDQEQLRLAEWLGSGMAGRGVEAAQSAGRQLGQELPTGATEAANNGALPTEALERELQQAEALQSLVRRLEFQEDPGAGAGRERWGALDGQGGDGGLLEEGPEAAEANRGEAREAPGGVLEPSLRGAPTGGGRGALSLLDLLPEVRASPEGLDTRQGSSLGWQAGGVPEEVQRGWPGDDSGEAEQQQQPEASSVRSQPGGAHLPSSSQDGLHPELTPVRQAPLSSFAHNLGALPVAAAVSAAIRPRYDVTPESPESPLQPPVAAPAAQPSPGPGTRPQTWGGAEQPGAVLTSRGAQSGGGASVATSPSPGQLQDSEVVDLGHATYGSGQSYAHTSALLSPSMRPLRGAPAGAGVGHGSSAPPAFVAGSVGVKTSGPDHPAKAPRPGSTSEGGTGGASSTVRSAEGTAALVSTGRPEAAPRVIAAPHAMRPTEPEPQTALSFTAIAPSANPNPVEGGSGVRFSGGQAHALGLDSSGGTEELRLAQLHAPSTSITPAALAVARTHPAAGARPVGEHSPLSPDAWLVSPEPLQRLQSSQELQLAPPESPAPNGALQQQYVGASTDASFLGNSQLWGVMATPPPAAYPAVGVQAQSPAPGNTGPPAAQPDTQAESPPQRTRGPMPAAQPAGQRSAGAEGIATSSNGGTHPHAAAPGSAPAPGATPIAPRLSSTLVPLAGGAQRHAGCAGGTQVHQGFGPQRSPLTTRPAGSQQQAGPHVAPPPLVNRESYGNAVYPAAVIQGSWRAAANYVGGGIQSKHSALQGKGLSGELGGVDGGVGELGAAVGRLGVDLERQRRSVAALVSSLKELNAATQGACAAALGQLHGQGWGR